MSLQRPVTAAPAGALELNDAWEEAIKLASHVIFERQTPAQARAAFSRQALAAMLSTGHIETAHFRDNAANSVDTMRQKVEECSVKLEMVTARNGELDQSEADLKKINRQLQVQVNAVEQTKLEDDKIITRLRQQMKQLWPK